MDKRKRLIREIEGFLIVRFPQFRRLIENSPVVEMCKQYHEDKVENSRLDVVSVTPDQLLSVANDIKLKLYKGEIKGDDQFEYLKDIDAIERVVKMLKPVS